jgi:hypothetical protein
MVEKRGSILIVCLIILSTLTVYGAVLISVVHERSLGVSLQVERLQAIYLAEAALSKSIDEIKSLADRNGDGLGTIPKTRLGNGIYFAVHNPATFTIAGVGEVNEVRRTVKIKYAGI